MAKTYAELAKMVNRLGERELRLILHLGRLYIKRRRMPSDAVDREIALLLEAIEDGEIPDVPDVTTFH